MLSQLTLENFRNFQFLELAPSPKINLILGENGSGKTSLLEAIHILGLGRSFRTRLLKNTVHIDQSYARVVGRIDRQTPLGFQYNTKDGLQIRLNNAPLKKLSELAVHLPLLYIPANCHAFFELGPRYRRQLIDWGLFHVKHEFLFHWQAYKKSLLQRNTALKQNKQNSEVVIWNKFLIDHGEVINQMRSDYLQQLKPLFVVYFNQLCPSLAHIEWSIRYSSGWSKDTSLSSALVDQLQRDRAMGYTRSGIHAADWSLRMNGADPAEMLSRGQQKLFFIAINFAVLDMLSATRDTDSLLLIDDVSAELDEYHQALIIQMLAKLSVQSYLTTTQINIETSLSGFEGLYKVFHVKQGQLQS